MLAGRRSAVSASVAGGGGTSEVCSGEAAQPMEEYRVGSTIRLIAVRTTSTPQPSRTLSLAHIPLRVLRCHRLVLWSLTVAIYCKRRHRTRCHGLGPWSLTFYRGSLTIHGTSPWDSCRVSVFFCRRKPQRPRHEAVGYRRPVGRSRSSSRQGHYWSSNKADDSNPWDLRNEPKGI